MVCFLVALGHAIMWQLLEVALGSIFQNKEYRQNILSKYHKAELQHLKKKEKKVSLSVLRVFCYAFHIINIFTLFQSFKSVTNMQPILLKYQQYFVCSLRLQNIYSIYFTLQASSLLVTGLYQKSNTSHYPFLCQKQILVFMVRRKKINSKAQQN